MDMDYFKKMKDIPYNAGKLEEIARSIDPENINEEKMDELDVLLNVLEKKQARMFETMVEIEQLLKSMED